ncbi:MAG: DUF3102 domain-containing protein [Actinobacteria bacterium]|nr:DUF3102 domain-containing protein [Actinomycetota bacterium]
MPLPQNSREGRELSSLAKEIRDENSAAERDALSAVAHARRAGELLIEAKAAVAHGEWGSWLSENVDFSQQWAASLMRVAKAPAAQIESAVSVRGALKQLAPPPKAEIKSGIDPVVEAVVKEAIKLGLDGPVNRATLEAKDPAELFDYAEAVDALRQKLHDAMTPFERYWLRHKGFIRPENVEALEETCEVAGMKPMIEILDDEYVWVGYVPVDADGEIANPLTFHPGWAHYCRHVLGDKVRFATEEMMPYTGPVTEQEEVSRG